MRIGDFEIQRPVPRLREVQAIVCLKPWIDAGDAGSRALSRLEHALHARPLGNMPRPGEFYDFTRYRPVIYMMEGRREIQLPNSYISYVRREKAPDFLFLHLLEPHMFGEEFVESLLSVLVRFRVKRYVLIGGMYDAVPHTRPLRVTGSASSLKLDQELKKLGLTSSGYEGPTTVMSLVSQRAYELGMETMLFLVHLPQYAPLEEDFSGQLRLLELLNSFYHLSLDLGEVRTQARDWYRQVTVAVENNPELRTIVGQLEEHYDEQSRPGPKPGAVAPKLAPDVERFLKRMSRRLER